MTPSFIAIIVACFVLSLLVTGFMRRFALRQRLLDIPNERSSHVAPTPRGGGVAVVASFCAAILALSFIEPLDARLLSALLLGGGLIAAVGFLDDRKPLPARVRFPVHVLAALLAVTLVGGIPERALANWGLHGPLIGSILGVLALIWATNLFNFMDGIDGIAAGEAVFIAGAGACFLWQSGDAALMFVMFSLAAASLGFLSWNWPPARIFMGDVGSGYLGFMLAALGIAASRRSAVPAEVWAILGGVFLVDSTVTLVRRVTRGDRWFEAHRTHAYQHLALRWKAHMPVTVLVLLIDVLWLLPWAVAAQVAPAHAALCLLAALMPLAVLAVLAGAGKAERQG
jgi:Fuc2NAc and GlcNAc transferase